MTQTGVVLAVIGAVLMVLALLALVPGWIVWIGLVLVVAGILTGFVGRRGPRART